MRASHRFARHRDGKTSFAIVGVESHVSSESSVIWSVEAAEGERFYAQAVRDGIRDAVKWHALQRGRFAQFEVVEFVQLLVDTQADAVRAAATVAAWESLGHSEEGLEFVFDGEWRVTKAA